jgi:hypothetical protein
MIKDFDIRKYLEFDRLSIKYIFVLFFIVLAVLSLFSRNLGLIYGIILTLFLPGFIVVNIFFKELERIEKLVLTLFLSVVLSTQLVYWLSIVIGYSKISIVLAGLLFIPAIFFVRLEWKDFRQVDFRLLKHPAILLTIGTFFIFYLVLSGSVWVLQGDNFILSGSNWQDTPMHLEIIESLNQGNFPPQMPYYSGVRMTYHYFVDLHTAIIEKMADMSNPRILVYLNSFFASLFALTVYMIANYVTNSRKAAVFAGIIGVFGGGFSYIRFFEAFFSYNWSKFSDLFSQNYVQEWQKFFQIVPTFEILLQSRPQMIGLPGLALSSYFLYRGLIEKDIKKNILAGVITGLLFPFHVTAFLSMGLISTLLILYSLSHDKFKFWLKGYLSFLIPVPLLSLPFILALDPATTSKLSFQPGWWAPDKSVLGLTMFYIGNLGIPFVMCFFYTLVQRKYVFFIYSWILAMFILPNMVTFTPDSFDMYKFFHFMWIPVAVATGCILSRLWNKKLYIVVTGLVILSIFTPFLDAAWNLSVKFPGYSLDEYNAGMWVRDNTPQGSVFLEEANIHAPPTQIGGRLRIMGYGTWPYGQGYEIWNRGDDIKMAFNGTPGEMSKIITKYNISYAYIGIEESRDYPGVKEKFDQYGFQRVYSDDRTGIWIYKLNANFNDTVRWKYARN